MEVCFIDVGQGTSNVILLGDQRAIVIDSGSQQIRTVIEVLHQFRIEMITRLIISHSHDDHSGGGSAILTAYQNRIEELWMLEDTRRASSQFWRRVKEELNAKRLNRNQIRLLVRDKSPKKIYQDDRILLSLISPDAVTNFKAVDDKDPNFTSAVIILKYGNQRIIFTGDSTIAEWQDIMELNQGRAFNCKIVTVPHHAGGVWECSSEGEAQNDFETRVRDNLDWFYSQAVRAEFGIISVGTNNTYGHPRQEVMSALLRAKVIPICTQMTSQCCNDLEAQRGHSLPLLLPSRSVMTRDMSTANRSRNVSCAGTILVEFQEQSVVIQRFNDHQDLVKQLKNHPTGRPMCRQ